MSTVSIAAIAPRPADQQATPRSHTPEHVGFDAVLAKAHDAHDERTTPRGPRAAEPGADEHTEVDPHAAAIAVAAQRRNTADAASGASSADAAALERMHAALRVNRDLDALTDPFRERLEQVMTRMESLGYRVRVLETHRTQERQEQLFAQGRSAPGPVVTWTLNSNHRAGRAADLHVSGGNGDGYEVLARVAREVGLRTLGPKDPGHIELPRNTAIDRQEVPAQQSSPLPADPAAAVAPLPSVARVAAVAQVAEVAVPGVSAGAGARVRGTRPADTRNEDAPSDTQADPGRHLVGSLAHVDAASSAGASGVTATAGAGATDIAGRIARALQVQDALWSRPASHVSLDVSDGDLAARIHVGLRGGELATRIDVSDPVVALRLEHRIDELRNALQWQGLEPASLQVRSLEQSRLDSLITSPRAETVSLAMATNPADVSARRGSTGNDHQPATGHNHDPSHRRPRRDTPQEETT